MLQAFIITLREGVEAALIIGITLAYLNKIQRADLRRAVFAGLGAAFVASIGAAIALSRLQLNEDIFEGWIMLAAAFLVITMVIFMMRTGKKMKGEIESKLSTIAGRGSQIGVFLFVFLMILREGAETVLFLAGVSLDTTALLTFIGTVAGILAAILFGVMFVKGSVRINLQKFFRVTTVILFLVAGQLIVSGLHELSENGVLPSSREEMALVGPIVSNEWFFVVMIVALAGLMVLFDAKRRQSAPLPEGSAEKRKAIWTARRERLWTASVYATSFLFVVLITAEFIYARSESQLSPATPVTVMNGKITIPLAEVSDGDLHRFSIEENGTKIRFLLYKRPDGKVVAVFDACEICGSVGYYKGPNGLVCKNCSAPINAQSVGTPGGCNPVPLQASSSGDAIVLHEPDVAAAAHLFQH